MRNGSWLMVGYLTVAACGNDGIVVRTVNEYDHVTPIAGVRVQVGDQEWVTTDEKGEASFAKADAPYVVRVHQTMMSPSGKNRHDDVWKVERSDSTAVIDVDGSQVDATQLEGTPRGASVSGVIQGASGAADTRVIVYVEGGGSVTAADGVFSTTSYWSGSESHTSWVYAFEVQGDPPAHYLAMASSTVVAADPTGLGGAVTGVTLQLTAVSDVHASGQVSVPASLAGTPLEITSTLRLQGTGTTQALGLATRLVSNAAASNPFNLAFPPVPGASRLISAVAGETFLTDLGPAKPGGSANLTVGTTLEGLTLSVPAPVTIVSPSASGAAVPPTTPIVWSTPPEAGHSYLRAFCTAAWAPTSGKLKVNYREIIADAANEATLPALPDLILPSGAECRTWVEWRPAPEDYSRSSWGDARTLTAP